jgi:hypothetical protein
LDALVYVLGHRMVSCSLTTSRPWFTPPHAQSQWLLRAVVHRSSQPLCAPLGGLEARRELGTRQTHTAASSASPGSAGAVSVGRLQRGQLATMKRAHRKP